MKKHNIIKVLAFFLILVGVQKTVNAQLEQSVYLNGTAPIGQFKSSIVTDDFNDLFDKENIGKEATLGFGVGYRICFIFDIGVGEVTPFFSADFYWNRVASEYRNQFIKEGAKVPNYLNVPLFVGVNYRYAFDVIMPFAEFGIGYDAMMVTAGGIKGSSEYYKYRIGGSFAWQLGVGSYFGNHFSVGIHYYGLGVHSINYKERDGENDLRNVGQFALRLGFHF